MSKVFNPFQPLLTESGLQRFSLKKRQFPACAGLTGIVHSYLQISTHKPSDYPIIPDGTQALFMSQHGTMISGGVSQGLDPKLPSPGEYFGVRFYPGALRQLFKVNVSEIGNQMVDSHFLSSSPIRRLHEYVYQLKKFHSRVRLCDQLLLEQLKRQSLDAFDKALAYIYQSDGNINITQNLTTKVGVSSRHLNRLFQQHTGLNTKSFAQTIRFQRACKHLSVHPENSLEIALNTGYFDQAHLLKDFRHRLEQSPVPFFNRFMSDFYNKNSRQ